MKYWVKDVYIRICRFNIPANRLFWMPGINRVISLNNSLGYDKLQDAIKKMK